jgi:membrane peptidoglycan carboxypeptidase
VTDNEGKVIETGQKGSQQVLHPEVAYIITDMLKTVMTSGTAASSRRLGFTRPAAGKTGTTDEYRDAWFVGYTPDLLCLIWTGYDDNTPLKMNGAQAALPIWIRFMKMAAARYPERDFTPASGVVAADIDAQTGKLAGPNCYDIRTELFIPGTEPEPCTEYDHEMLYAGGSDLQIVGNTGTTIPGSSFSSPSDETPTSEQPAIVAIPSDEDSTGTDSDSTEKPVKEAEPRPDQPIYFAPPAKNDASSVKSNTDLNEQKLPEEQVNDINGVPDQNTQTQKTQTQDSGRETSNDRQNQTSETDQDEPQSQPPP